MTLMIFSRGYPIAAQMTPTFYTPAVTRTDTTTDTVMDTHTVK